MDFTCKDGSTPLVWAVAARRAEMAEVLIHKGAKVDLNPSPKDSPSCLLADKSVVPLQPLHVAARAGASNLVKLILREGAQVGARTDRLTDRRAQYLYLFVNTQLPSNYTVITLSLH